MSNPTRKQKVLAVVTYPAPHGQEAAQLLGGEALSFGRGSECEVRFGYAPEPDRDVPRVAGRLIGMEDRVFIQSAATVGHRALEVQSTSGTTSIAIGQGLSPRETLFSILVRGTVNVWTLEVAVRSGDPVDWHTNPNDPPTSHYSLDLTDQQMQVVLAYAQPYQEGRQEPATHAEVASRLSYHPNTVREIIYGVWKLMFEQGIPMPDVDNKPTAVVESARLHGLI